MPALSTAQRCLLAAASGLLFFLAFPPMQWHWLAWIALVPLLLAVHGARARVAVLCAALHTVFFYGFSVYWVFTIMREYGKLSAFAAAGVFLLLLVYIWIFNAAFCAAVAWLSRREPAWAWGSVPFLWVTMELAFTRVPHFALPWNLLGYAATNQLAVLQIASATGVYGLSFLMAGYAALLACVISRKGATSHSRALYALCGATALLVPVLGGGTAFVPQSIAPFRARLIQANLSTAEFYGRDWPERFATELDEMERLSIFQRISVHDLPVTDPQPLIVWPEIPAPIYLPDPRLAARTTRITSTTGANLLLGVVEWRADGVKQQNEPQRLYPRNSAVLVGPGGERVYTYDKIHLVPFGEYVPFRNLLSFAESLVAEVGGFLPGRERTLAQLPQGKFATLICFEAVFPNEVREFVAGGANLLVNISNDGWLGRTGGPAQHLEMARMRAVENRRWLLRATNTGHTVAIDPYGRIVARIAPHQRAALEAQYDIRSDLTIYTRFGDWFAWLCVAVSGVTLAAGWRGSK